MNTATNPRTRSGTSAGGGDSGNAEGLAGTYDALDLRTRPQRLLDGLVGACKAALATGGLPAQIRRSLTWDCGAEMARHATITATGLPVFFAHPHSPWERGSNENLNRIVREYFPKGTPISSDPKYLAMVACDINDRPRKIHNWKKPSELFTELVESNASTG